MPTPIVQSVANLWTPLDAEVRLWTTGTPTSFANPADQLSECHSKVA